MALKFVETKEIKDLRPINMVGCVYKVISKLLTQRMRCVMLGLVRESQSAFVKGRKIHNGALIACETMQWLKLKKKASVIIKLDFKKTYARVKWCFVDTMLEKMGFGSIWRAWIRKCIRSSSILFWLMSYHQNHSRWRWGFVKAIYYRRFWLFWW